MAMTGLFILITLAFAGIALAAALAGRWVIAAAAVPLAGWMGSLAWSAMRKTRA